MMDYRRRTGDKKAKYTPLHYILWAVAILFMLGWLRVGWVLFYPYEPLIVHEAQKILNPGKEVKAGGFVLMESYFTKNTDASATVTRMFVNDFIYYLKPYEAALPKAINKRVKIPPIPVPPEAAPGKFRLYTTYAYKVSDWPERYITVPAWSEWFTITRDQDERDEMVVKRKHK